MSEIYIRGPAREWIGLIWKKLIYKYFGSVEESFVKFLVHVKIKKKKKNIKSLGFLGILKSFLKI